MYLIKIMNVTHFKCSHSCYERHFADNFLTDYFPNILGQDLSYRLKRLVCSFAELHVFSCTEADKNREIDARDFNNIETPALITFVP